MSDGMSEAIRDTTKRDDVTFHFRGGYLQLTSAADLSDCLTIIRMVLTYVKQRFNV
jgi:hypothetical protein